jgi:hypothetical protein
MLYVNDFPDDVRAAADICQKSRYKWIKKCLIQFSDVCRLCLLIIIRQNSFMWSLLFFKPSSKNVKKRFSLGRNHFNPTPFYGIWSELHWCRGLSNSGSIKARYPYVPLPCHALQYFTFRKQNSWKVRGYIKTIDRKVNIVSCLSTNYNIFRSDRPLSPMPVQNILIKLISIFVGKRKCL